MASTWARTRARERIAALGAAGLEDRDLRRQVLAVLREVIDFDAYVWLLTDPVTAVGAAPLAEVPCITELPALIKAKYATPVNRWTALQLQACPVGLLNDAVGGDLSRSHVWREVMSRYGIGDVASAVFADQYGCWGFLDLWRGDTRGPFDGTDAEFIATLAAPLTSALRHCQARTFVEPAAAHRHDVGPVVLTVDEDLRITSRTAASRAWLNVLLPPEPDERAIPASVYNVAAQLLAAEEGIDAHPAYARISLAVSGSPCGPPGSLPATSKARPPTVAPPSSSRSRRHPPPSALTCSAAPSASPPANTNCSGCLPPAATPAPWPARCHCPSTRSRTTSSRSSPRPAPATASPFYRAPSAPDVSRTDEPRTAIADDKCLNAGQKARRADQRPREVEPPVLFALSMS
jgi:hypothetical protein